VRQKQVIYWLHFMTRRRRRRRRRRRSGWHLQRLL